jgi:hypothetical protein
MARRAGWQNGLAVFALAILVPAILAAILSSQADQVDPNAGSTALGNLRSIGIPTSGDEWAEIGTIVGLGSLLAMLIGSVLGGSSASAGTASSRVRSTPRPAPSSTSQPGATATEATTATTAEQPT